MQLWFATIVGLNENEDENCIYIMQLMVSNIKWNVIIFVINNVVHRWSDNTWHFMQFELQLYIIVANVHVLMVN
jgi:hypothetical protein